MMDTRDILQQADDFAEAFKRCSKGENPRKDEFNRICADIVSIPAIVNAAFSCELYFKSMLKQPWGHKLKDLFEQLDIETQLQLKSEFDTNFTKHPVYNFDVFLNDISDAFIEWRYVFEESHTEGFYGCYINEFFMFFNCFLPIVKRIAHERFTAR